MISCAFIIRRLHKWRKINDLVNLSEDIFTNLFCWIGSHGPVDSGRRVSRRRRDRIFHRKKIVKILESYFSKKILFWQKYGSMRRSICEKNEESGKTLGRFYQHFTRTFCSNRFKLHFWSHGISRLFLQHCKYFFYFDKRATFLRDQR